MKIAQFNVVHIILIILALLTSMGLTLVFNKYELDDKKDYLKKMSIIGFVLLIIRLIWIIFDKNYDYDFFDEWILNPLEIICCICGLVYVIKKYQFLPIIYFLGIIWSILIVIFPSTKYLNTNIFSVRNILYYGLVYINLLICLFTSTLYCPKVKDVLPTVQIIFITMTFAFCINVLLKLTLLNKGANYFYTVEPNELKIFTFIYNFIPIGYLYFLLVILLLWICFYLMIGIHRLLEKPVQKLKKYLNHNIYWYLIGCKVIKKVVH